MSFFEKSVLERAANLDSFSDVPRASHLEFYGLASFRNRLMEDSVSDKQFKLEQLEAVYQQLGSGIQRILSSMLQTCAIHQALQQ